MWGRLGDSASLETVPAFISASVNILVNLQVDEAAVVRSHNPNCAVCLGEWASYHKRRWGHTAWEKTAKQPTGDGTVRAYGPTWYKRAGEQGTSSQSVSRFFHCFSSSPCLQAWAPVLTSSVMDCYLKCKKSKPFPPHLLLVTVFRNNKRNPTRTAIIFYLWRVVLRASFQSRTLLLVKSPEKLSIPCSYSTSTIFQTTPKWFCSVHSHCRCYEFLILP